MSDPAAIARPSQLTTSHPVLPESHMYPSGSCKTTEGDTVISQ